MTASLMDGERPKSSALTMRRLAASGRAIIWDDIPGHNAQPGAQDEHNLLSLAYACQFGTKHVEFSSGQFFEQSPIDRPHQFRRSHGAAIFPGQCFARETVKMPGAIGHAGGEFAITRRVFTIENLGFGDTEAL